VADGGAERRGAARSARFLGLCLLACASSALADWLMPQRSVSIGASGVVAALLVFFALALPHARVALFFWPLVYRGGSGWLHLPVRAALVLWLLGQPSVSARSSRASARSLMRPIWAVH
jgi:membrane associated rhomboid family serine protease